MLAEPQCSKRGCAHFQGCQQSDDTESTEIVVCDAFPDGIPDVIAFGSNPHTSPYPGDRGIQYKQADA